MTHKHEVLQIGGGFFLRISVGQSAQASKYVSLKTKRRMHSPGVMCSLGHPLKNQSATCTIPYYSEQKNRLVTSHTQSHETLLGAALFPPAFQAEVVPIIIHHSKVVA